MDVVQSNVLETQDLSVRAHRAIAAPILVSAQVSGSLHRCVLTREQIQLPTINLNFLREVTYWLVYEVLRYRELSLGTCCAARVGVPQTVNFVRELFCCGFGTAVVLT